MSQLSTPMTRLLVLGSGLVLRGLAANAQVLDRGIDAENRITQQAAEDQARINQDDEQTQRLVEEYRHQLAEPKSRSEVKTQMENVLGNQEKEIVSINKQLDGLEETNRDVVPLMIEMADALLKLVQADMPFRQKERVDRAKNIIDSLDRSDITNSEKYRLIVEAYQVELEYGRTMEAYRGALPDGQQVEFLRIGRTLLFWQSLDGKNTGWWNPNSRSFERLEDRYRLPVSDGLQIAHNQVAPDLISLPVPAPESE